MTTMPTGYFNRFEESKEYDEHLFVAGRALQSSELNEIQRTASNRLRGVADVLFKDGAIVRDASVLLDQTSGLLRCSSGAVYIRGAVRGLAPSEFIIPVEGVVAVGVRLIESVVTSAEDAALRDPVLISPNQDENGAERLKTHSQWAWADDGGAGDFFPIYEVIDGIVTAKEPPPSINATVQSIARYDRDSAGGSYVVNGMRVSKLTNAANGNQLYSIADGRARVYGFGVEFSTSRRVQYPTNPDLRAITNEPHTSTTMGSQRVGFASGPGEKISILTITAEKTVTLTHGPVTGYADDIGDTSVVSIQSVAQGGTTYVAGTSFLLSGNKVDWSPGGAEPSTGSTYTVVYRYIKTVAATNVDANGFSVAGAVVGTQILVSYQQQLPRIDRLCMDTNGHAMWFSGVSATSFLQPPSVPGDILPLASVIQRWGGGATVINDAVRLVPMPILAGIESRLDYLTQMVAQHRLEANIHTREGGTKKGIFVDPFVDSSQRDSGTPQSGAISDGHLVLSLALSVSQMGTDIASPVSLPFSVAFALSQSLRTGSMKINPYLAFTPGPLSVTLTPDIDRWTVNLVRNIEDIVQASDVASVRQVLTTSAAAELRPIEVRYSILGFGNSEVLQSLEFDGISLPTEGATANADGELVGSFTIPQGIPVGSKRVQFTGAQGRIGEATFVGSGTIETATLASISRPFSDQYVDPVAQTFQLERNSQIAGVDLWFTGKPTTEVVVQIRETSLGFPDRIVIAEKRIPASSVSTLAHTRIIFNWPVTLIGGAEYALIVMCNDASGAVAIAELGAFDAVTQRWISSQPYSVGTLLSSSNASTWTAHQDKDLAFRLLAPQYAATSQLVNLGSVNVSGVTDLMLLATSDQPSSQTSVSYTLTMGASVLTVDAGQTVSLSSPYTGSVLVQAHMSGSVSFSPVLRQGSQLFLGSVATTGTYVTRAVPAGASSVVKVIYEAVVPSGASVVAEIKGPDVNDVWMPAGAAATRAVDDGYVEFVHTSSSISEASIQVRLTLSGGAAARPRVRDLRVIVL